MEEDISHRNQGKSRTHGLACKYARDTSEMATIQARNEAKMWVGAADLRSGEARKRLGDLRSGGARANSAGISLRRENDNSTHAPTNVGNKVAIPHQFLTGHVNSFYDNSIPDTTEAASGA